jgi:hypothetical protein
MKTAIMLFGFEGVAFAVRLESVRPAAKAGLWFEPNGGHVKGRTVFARRTCRGHI